MLLFPWSVPVARAVHGELGDAGFTDVGAGNFAGVPVAATLVPALLELENEAGLGFVEAGADDAARRWVLLAAKRNGVVASQGLEPPVRNGDVQEDIVCEETIGRLSRLQERDEVVGEAPSAQARCEGRHDAAAVAANQYGVLLDLRGRVFRELRHDRLPYIESGHHVQIHNEPTTDETSCLDFVSMYVTRRNRRSSSSRARILAAVRSLLEEGVFHETTVEEVAVHAGVSRATLYGHFGSRLGLVDAMCESFDVNPALVSLRETADPDLWLERVVDFWSSEEKVLGQLYGAAAVDPAARALVERQTRDRYGELEALLRSLGRGGGETLAALAILSSFETYLELRRRLGKPKRQVVAILQQQARALLAHGVGGA